MFDIPDQSTELVDFWNEVPAPKFTTWRHAPPTTQARRARAHGRALYIRATANNCRDLAVWSTTDPLIPTGHIAPQNSSRTCVEPSGTGG